MAATSARICSTGRNVRPTRNQINAASTPAASGTAIDSDVISVVTLSLMSSVDAARYTMTSPSGRSTIRLSSRTSPSMPGNGSPLPIVWPAVIGSPIGGSPSISGLDAKTSPSTATI